MEREIEEGRRGERPDLGQRGGMDGSFRVWREKEHSLREGEMKDKPGLKQEETVISLHSSSWLHLMHSLRVSICCC